jgi:geranylgeranyl pyrophosphate synthase
MISHADRAFKLSSDFLATDVPGAIDLLNDSALTGGKKFRPQLLMKVAGCLQIYDQTALPYAIAAERIHNATLLHDDVIDESRFRRGRATLNASGENQRAILGGDLLLARTLRELGVREHLDIIRDLFDVLVQLSEGEWLQLEARGQMNVTERHLQEVARKKTGSLLAWCCATPARLGNLPLDMVDALRTFGTRIGVAFQLADDCADFKLTSGKPFAQDLCEGQINFVIQDLLSREPAFYSEIDEHYFAESVPIKSFSKQFLDEVKTSVDRVLEKAQMETAIARDLLHRSGLRHEICAEIDRQVLIPFQAELQ